MHFHPCFINEDTGGTERLSKYLVPHSQQAAWLGFELRQCDSRAPARASPAVASGVCHPIPGFVGCVFKFHPEISTQVFCLLLLANLFYLLKTLIYFIWLCRALVVTCGVSVGSCRVFHCSEWAFPAAMHGLSCSTACGILVPRPGIEQAFPCIARQILDQWTTREVCWPI